MEKSANSLFPSYFVCPSCGIVIHDPSRAMVNPNIPAPCCGATGGIRATWPPPAVSALLECAETQSERHQSLVLILAMIVQVLLESTIIGMMKSKPKGNWSENALIHKKRDIASLIAVHDSLSQWPLESVLGSAFINNILLLARLRDAIVADFFHTLTDEQSVAVDFTYKHLLKAFMTLHNDIRGRSKDAEIKPPRKKNILIVDDELAVLERMGNIVERQGVTARKAPDGATAMRLFNELKPDCVFLDISLPDMDGFAIIAKMKEIDPYVTVYFITGMGGEAFAKEARRLGAAGYLPKPIDLVVLNKIIKSV